MSLSEYKTILDLQHPSGKPTWINQERLNAEESLQRGRGRYVENLPPGMVAHEQHPYEHPIRMG
jgi:hypothetical protein